MMIELDQGTITTVAIALFGGIATLYSRNTAIENKMLKSEIDTLKTQHNNDIARIDNCHEDIWIEIKCQREALSQNKEAVIKLNASIERLNEILPGLERMISGKVSLEQCQANQSNCIDRRKLPACEKSI